MKWQCRFYPVLGRAHFVSDWAERTLELSTNAIPMSSENKLRLVAQ
jgi:hypothetical protein